MYFPVKVTIYQKFSSAHAGAAPWEGKNALDAAVIAYSSISSLRQQLKPEIRVHGIIEGKNWAPNVIPDYSKLTYIVRAPHSDDLVDTVNRVRECFHGAASATGCTVKIDLGHSYFDLIQNPVLVRDFSNNVKNRYHMSTNMINSTASTDFGNVSFELPAIHPLYGEYIPRLSETL